MPEEKMGAADPRKVENEEIPYMDEDYDPFFPACAAGDLDSCKLDYMVGKWEKEPFESPRGLMRRMAVEILIARGEAEPHWMIGPSAKQDDGGELYWAEEDAAEEGALIARDDEWDQLWIFPVILMTSSRHIHPYGRPERVQEYEGAK